ncbi:MAG TPA: SapB/AmfS family lanthipeptide [Trebonia sp.]|nr:SapB/AmfS family lanthipeptide [Trebonia sp.]
MALLDMQGLTATRGSEDERGCGEGGGGSEASLLLCASVVSIQLCL